MPRVKPVQAEDIYRIQRPVECRVAPDGTRVAVVVSKADKESLKYQSHIWLVPTRGGTPIQFTQGKHQDSHPRFSPDGKTIAFLSDRSGSAEIWTIAVDGGEARQLTHLGGGVGEFAFHPRGGSLVIAFTPKDAEVKEREERKKRGESGVESPRVRTIDRLSYKLDGAGFLPKNRQHLWLVNAHTGKARRLTEDERYAESSPCFSPDGKWIYFNSNRSANPDFDLMRVGIWRMPSRGGPIERVKTFEGPSTSFSLSPDGRWIAFLGTRDPDAPWGTRHTKLWLAPATGGRPVELTARLDRECDHSTISDTRGPGGTSNPIWSPDSQWVAFVVTNEGNGEIWAVHIRKRRPEPVLNRAGAVIDFDYHFPSRAIYATFTDLRNPGELYRFSRVGKPTAERMTDWNGWLRERQVTAPEEFWFQGRGRHRLQGWILRSPRRRARKAPGLLYIHGGPGTQYGRVFFHEFQFLAGRGYTVFYSNPRGGTGYSEKHLAAIHDAWGTIDYDDLMSFTDEALRRSPELDRRRLGVAGGSYGGYMTNWIITHTDRFAAAITQRSVVNLMSFAGSSDFGYAWFRVFGGHFAWREPAHYLAMSPITYVDSVKTPTLIEHQENDHRCPIEQAEQLYAALKARKVPVEFHRYPDEPHGMSRGGRPDRRIERLHRIAGWLDRWLGKPRNAR